MSYVDLHCHLLPGVDDGAATLEDALAHARRLDAEGVRDVAAIGHQLRRPRRRMATLTVHSLGERRFSFADLRPHTAATIERHVRAAAPRAL